MNHNYPLAYYNKLDTDISLWLQEIDRKAKGGPSCFPKF
jgi:hypothetical protein